jgi:Tat protein secretion system quality control protein TatD with DNase activity
MYGRQGAPNEPQYLTDVVDVIHELFAVSPDQTTSITTENYLRLFNAA